METEEAWSSIESSVDNILQSMEAYRRNAYKYGFGLGLLLGCIAALVLYIVSQNVALTLTIGIAVWLITFILTLALAFVKLDKRYKKEIMPILTATVCPNATYDAKLGVDISSFFASGIFKQHANEVLANEDGIRGNVGDVSFVFCESHLAYSEESIVNGKKKKNNVRHFDGMVLDLTLPQSTSDNAILTTLSTIEGMAPAYTKLCPDNTAFGKLFSTYSTSDTLPAIAEQAKQNIVDLYNTIKQNMGESDMTVSFWNNKILIVVPNFKNRFEAKILSSLKIKRVYEDFAIINEMGKIATAFSKYL